MPLARLLLVLPLALAGCATPLVTPSVPQPTPVPFTTAAPQPATRPEPQEPPRPMPYSPPSYEPKFGAPASSGRWGQRTIVEAHAIQAWLHRDFDGISDSTAQVDATGWSVRGAIGNAYQSIGVQFQDLYSENDALDVTTLGIDTDARLPLDDGGGMFWARAGGGFGTAWIEMPGRSTSQLEAQLRVGLDFQPSERFLVDVSFGGILIGHFGETEAYGTFASIGAALVF